MAGPELKPFPVQGRDETTPVPFRAKLLNVMRKVAYVQKRGLNAHFNYKYATEADVAEKVREALLEERLLFVPTAAPPTQRGNVTEVMLHCSLLDVDSDAHLEWDMPGAGQDPGDKGPYKAVTGAEKYALMKLFLISTGDDPEADDAGNDDAPAGTVTERDVREVFDATPVDQAAELRAAQDAQARNPVPVPPVKPTPRPRKSEAISEGKLKRLYALMYGEAQRLETTIDAVKVTVLNRLGAEFGLERVEDIPWRGDTYKTVCGWLGAVDNANQ